MKKRGEPAERKMRKRGTIANYINEVCDYEAGYERYGSGEYSYPPIVPKLLLSILICLKPLVFILNALAGVGFCLLLKLLF